MSLIRYWDTTRYPRDLTCDEWTLVRPRSPSAKRCGHKRLVDVHEFVNELMYILSTSCQCLIVIGTDGEALNRRADHRVAQLL